MSTVSTDQAQTPNIPPSASRRIISTLFVTQSLFSASMIASIVLMPIIATDLTGNVSLAGLPNTLLFAGRALVAYPMGWLMDQRGRRFGITIGYLLSSIGALVSVQSIIAGSFIGFCSGTALFGMGRGVSEQTRFVAAEIVHTSGRARAISLIVFAGTVGAIGGPLLVPPSGSFAEQFGIHSDAGPYMLGAVLTAIATLLAFGLLRPDPLDIAKKLEADAPKPKGTVISTRPVREILSGSRVQLAIVSMVLGQLVMTLLMVITPLYMDGFSYDTRSISWVIMAHTLGMFGLSGVTGYLVDHYGRIATIIAGAILLIVAAVVTPIWVTVPTLMAALFLLGLGWNFCFIAGSSLLSESLSAGERGRIQGANEGLVAIASSVGSLGTGIAFGQGGILLVSGIGSALAAALIFYTLWSGQSEEPVAAVGD